MLELNIDSIEHGFLLDPGKVGEMLFRELGIENPIRHRADVTMRAGPSREGAP